MNYPTNLLRAFAVACSWRIHRYKDNPFLLIYKIMITLVTVTLVIEAQVGQ